MARSRNTPDQPMLDPVALASLTPVGVDALAPGADLEGVEVLDVEAATLDLSRADVHESRLAGVRARELVLGGATLVESVISDADAPVVRGVRGTWRDVTVRDSRFGSAELYESRWRGVHLVGCRLGYVNLRGSELMDVQLTDCVVDELDLVQATATRLALVGTRVRHLDLQASTLRHVDLRGAQLEELSGVDALSGVTITPDQLGDLAPALAAHLGITVLDGSESRRA
ncbi:MAG: pentapeptide repeat-containing protein [Promicromonosporaceae bacterium]|nr:pentapeptide repeat-containing protein [Promicromonosporaceae bacterium]